jgi:hypothetical protein
MNELLRPTRSSNGITHLRGGLDLDTWFRWGRRNARRDLVRKRLVKCPLYIQERRGKDNTEIGLRKIGYEDGRWMELGQYHGQWLTASVVCWSELRATDPEVTGSIPGHTRFSEKSGVWNGVHSAPWGQLRSYLNEKLAAPVYKTEINGHGNSLHWPRNTLYPQRLDNRWSVGRLVRLRTTATEFSLLSYGWLW